MTHLSPGVQDVGCSVSGAALSGPAGLPGLGDEIQTTLWDLRPGCRAETH